MTHAFRVRVPRSRMTVKVVVYDTVRDFKRRAGERSRRMMAFCAPVESGRCFAEIHIPKRYLSTSTIVHEAFHATCRFVERRGGMAIPITGQVSNMDPGGPESGEELTAIILDGLCGRIERQLHRRKLYPGVVYYADRG
jgi:hypothetical protein